MKAKSWSVIFASLAVLILLGWGASDAAAQGEEWVAIYDGPASGDEWTNGIAADGEGNVYVTGPSLGGGGFDYATVKYDTDGNEIWVARYDGSAGSDDYPFGVAADASGNVYVTGASYGIGTSADCVTIKYDAGGNELWVARYDGPVSNSDRCKSIALDAAGNVHVTGSSAGTNGPTDFVTIKYDTGGNELWVARYSSPVVGLGPEGGHLIALDGSGNVYVTGNGEVGGTRDIVYTTLKYDAAGNMLWVATYEGPGPGSHSPWGLAVDPLGNAYVTGYSAGDTTPYDYATVKYDADGNELWVARYDGPGHGEDMAWALAVDEAGNAYVTGHSAGAGTAFDYATVKYDTDGNEIWVARYTSPGAADDWGLALALDPTGYLWVTGSDVGADTYEDYATLQYDLDGNLLFGGRYDGTGSGDDWGLFIALDASGNAYVSGQSWGGETGYDFATLKYAGTPDPEDLVQYLTDAIESFLEAGDLNTGEGGSLLKILRNAVRMYEEQGNLQGACNLLENFIKQIQKLVDQGDITPEEGQALIDQAMALMEQIGC